MLARPTLTKQLDHDDGEKPVSQTRPTKRRLLLRVDGQPKRSFSSLGIGYNHRCCGKKAYPVVMVTVVDTEDGTIEVIKG